MIDVYMYDVELLWVLVFFFSHSFEGVHFSVIFFFVGGAFVRTIQRICGCGLQVFVVVGFLFCWCMWFCMFMPITPPPHPSFHRRTIESAGAFVLVRFRCCVVESGQTADQERGGMAHVSSHVGVVGNGHVLRDVDVA